MLTRKLTREEKELIKQRIVNLGTNFSQTAKKFYQEANFKKSSAGYKLGGLCGITQDEALVLYKILGEDPSLNFLTNYQPLEEREEITKEKYVKKQKTIREKSVEPRKKETEYLDSKEDIEKAREALIDSYLNYIKNKYLKSGTDERIKLTHGLEKVLEELG